MSATDLERRVEALETRAAHQERTIEDLNATVTAQWRILDALKRELSTLDDRVHDLGERDGRAPERPPPHY